MTTGYTLEQKQIVLFRDGFKCPMCGSVAREVNHRANRGAGGFKGANTLSNGCAICHDCNGRIEADADYAWTARQRGVKLSRYDDPLLVPYLHPLYQIQVLLDDQGGFTFVTEDIG